MAKAREAVGSARRVRPPAAVVTTKLFAEQLTELKLLAAVRNQTIPEVIRDVAGDVIRTACDEQVRDRKRG